MTGTLKRIKDFLVPIGVIVSILASIFALIILYQLLLVLPTHAFLSIVTDNGDPKPFQAIMDLTVSYHDLYWLLALIAIEIGLLTSLWGRGYRLTFMIHMLLLTLSALSIRGVYVWTSVMWSGTHHDILLFAQNVLFYEDRYIVGLPVSGLALAVILSLFHNRKTKTANTF